MSIRKSVESDISKIKSAVDFRFSPDFERAIHSGVHAIVNRKLSAVHITVCDFVTLNVFHAVFEGVIREKLQITDY